MIKLDLFSLVAVLRDITSLAGVATPAAGARIGRVS